MIYKAISIQPLDSRPKYYLMLYDTLAGHDDNHLFDHNERYTDPILETIEEEFGCVRDLSDMADTDTACRRHNRGYDCDGCDRLGSCVHTKWPVLDDTNGVSWWTEVENIDDLKN